MKLITSDGRIIGKTAKPIAEPIAKPIAKPKATRKAKSPKLKSSFASILSEREVREYQSKCWPMNLSSGTYLTPVPSIETVRKWTAIPTDWTNAKDYVRQFDELNHLTSGNLEWVKVDYHIEDFIREDYDELPIAA